MICGFDLVTAPAWLLIARLDDGMKEKARDQRAFLFSSVAQAWMGCISSSASSTMP